MAYLVEGTYDGYPLREVVKATSKSEAASKVKQMLAHREGVACVTNVKQLPAIQ